MRTLTFLAIAGLAFVVVVAAYYLHRSIESGAAFLPAVSSGPSSGPGTATGPEAVARCLGRSGAVIFGTEWCPACRQQADLFGEAFYLLDYVDCDVDPVECAEAGVTGVPAWEIDGELFVGVQPLERLTALGDCREEPSPEVAAPPVFSMPEPTGEVTRISYSWRDASGTYRVTSEPPPRDAREVSVFR